MSDFLAAAGVMAIVRYILQNAVTDQLSAALNTTPSITALPPDRVQVGANEAPQLNVFLYHVSFNQGWRNADLPSRDAAGGRLTNPPLPLDLHFLLSAYGKSEFDGEILLGWAMQVLHETPVLSGQFIQAILQQIGTPAPPPGGGAAPPVASELKAIAATTLAEQPEAIKIVPENVSTEDIWKLWTAFQASYRTTAAYRASVVLIRATQAIRSNLPVQQPPNILVQPSRPPIIDNLAPSLLGTGEVLTVTGRNFIGTAPADTRLVFDDGSSLSPDLVQGQVIRIALPPAIPAGARLVRVSRNLQFGTPGDPHPGFSSNSASFMLVPAVTGTIPPSIKPGATLTLGINPPVGNSQSVALLIGDNAVAIDARPPGGPATTSSLAFPLPASFPVPSAATPLPLRVEVDGAQSRIALDASGHWQPSIAVVAP